MLFFVLNDLALHFINHIVDCLAAIRARVFCNKRFATVSVQNQFTSRFAVFGIKDYFARFKVLAKTLKTLHMHSSVVLKILREVAVATSDGDFHTELVVGGSPRIP